MIRFRSFFILLGLCLLPQLVQAGLELSGQLTQGGLISGRVPPGTRVVFAGRELRLTAGGQFIFGFGRDTASTQSLTLIPPDGTPTNEELHIIQRSYQIERIDGIDRHLMEPTAEEQQRIAEEAEQVSKARQIDSSRDDFLESFIWPLKGRISGVYGSQRILNGEPRRPHFGVDISAPSGSLVVAPAGGVVTLSHPGMFFSGATLIIDHGHGLSSSFLHLAEILVKPGERVEQGQPIARVGASGRVTGPHLDWRVNWFDTRLDPQLMVP